MEAMRNCEIIPTAAQAEAIKMFSEEKKLDGNAIYGLLLKKKNSGNGVTISAKKISSYFPPAYTKQEIENVIYTLLEEWKNGREEELEHGEDTIDYYRGMEAEQYSFYRVPKILFTAECFKEAFL